MIAIGDITRFAGDGIVNAANTALAGGGGVDGAIHRAAGPELLALCREMRNQQWPDGLPTGRAVLTDPGRLPLKGIIHAVGPVWRGGHACEDDLLRDAYRSSLSIANHEGWKTLAIPAISTGAYGFPKDRAACIAFRTIRDFIHDNSLPETIILVFFSQVDADSFMTAIEALADT
jgi:O-acetyl-ADP-ribose deacetylase (regulator of RNase III)